MNTKQQILIALIAVLAFASCGTVSFEDDPKEEESQISNTGTRTVTFSVGYNNVENVTKASSTVAKERFSYLQYWIYDDNYENVLASGKQQATKDENFGTFSATLSYGTYHVVVIGHNLSSAMELNKSGMLVLDESNPRLLDTYYGNAECTVGEYDSSSTTITMKRNICNLYVMSNGLATNVGSVDVELNAYGLDFGVKDGLSGSEQQKYSYSIVFTEDMRKKEYTHLSVFFPLPANGTVFNKVSVTLTAKDLDGNKLGSAVIENIPAKIGYRIKYTRNLWSGDATINVVVSDEDWVVVDGDNL